LLLRKARCSVLVAKEQRGLDELFETLT